jgi:hypothetical protein
MLTLTSAACATHETMARPPSVADIARINGFADKSGSMRVTSDLQPLGPPAAAFPPVVSAARLAPFGNGMVALQQRDGGAYLEPLVGLTSVTVRDRPRGALIGAGIGAAAGLGVSLLALLLLRSVGRDDPSRGVSNDCDKTCIIAPAVVTLSAAGAGAIIGTAVGSPRVFDFDRR